MFAASVPASGSPTYTPAVTNTVPVGTSPHDVAVDPDTGTVYVANNDNPGTVSVISEATDTVTKTITVASYPQGWPSTRLREPCTWVPTAAPISAPCR